MRLLFVLALLVAAPASAATRYVDGALTTICNTYNVTTRTCQGGNALGYPAFTNAVAAMAAGDTVAVRAGTYKTPFVVTKSGTAGAHLTFTDYNAEIVIIDLAGVGNNASGIDIRNQRYLDFTGFVIRNSPLYGFRGGSNADVSLSDVEIAYSFHSGIVFEGGANLKVTRAKVHHNNNGGTWHEAVTFQAVDGFSITDSEVYENGKEGIDAKYGSKNGTIARNQSYRNNGPNIYIDAVSNVTVEANVCRDTRSTTKACIGLSIESAANPSHFVTANILVYNNVIYGSGAGIWFWLESEDAWAVFSGIRIENNTIADNNLNTWGGIYFLNGQPANYGQGNTILRNVIMGNGGIGLRNGANLGFSIDRNAFQVGETSSTFGTGAQYWTQPFVNRAAHDYHLTTPGDIGAFQGEAPPIPPAACPGGRVITGNVTIAGGTSMLAGCLTP